MAIEVVLDALSGRPNPVWTLTQTEEAEFLSRLTGFESRAVTEGQPRLEPPLLGYRGFEIRSPDGKPLPEKIRVFGGTVRLDKSSYPDAGRELEKWLLQSGAQHARAPKELIEAIGRELGSQ